jgi:hypothetical protein
VRGYAGDIGTLKLSSAIDLRFRVITNLIISIDQSPRIQLSKKLPYQANHNSYTHSRTYIVVVY